MYAPEQGSTEDVRERQLSLALHRLLSEIVDSTDTFNTGNTGNTGSGQAQSANQNQAQNQAQNQNAVSSAIKNLAYVLTSFPRQFAFLYRDGELFSLDSLDRSTDNKEYENESDHDNEIHKELPSTSGDCSGDGSGSNNNGLFIIVLNDLIGKLLLSDQDAAAKDLYKLFPHCFSVR